MMRNLMSVKNKKPLKAVLTGIIYLSAMQFAFAADNSLIYEQCYISKVKDNKVGYSCTVQEKATDSAKSIFITTQHSEQKFKRLGVEVKMVQDFKYIEDELGNPLQLEAKIQSLGDLTEVKAEFSVPNKVIVTSVVNGVKEIREIPLDKKVLFPYAISKLLKENPDKDSIQFSTIDPHTDFRIISVTYEKLGEESLKADNLPDLYSKYKVIIDLLPNIGNYEWYDSQGRLVKGTSSILNIEQIAVSKDKISEKYDADDIFYKSLVPVKNPITDPLKLSQVTYKVQTGDSHPNDVFIEDDRQRIIQVKDNIAYLKIKNEDPKIGKFKYPVNTAGKSAYLKSGVFITSDNPQIKQTALSLVGQEKDAYKICKTLENWVYKNITRKTFSVNFANATEVFNSRQGDCTEHAVLLAAMLRAVNIPSKIVVGMTYTDTPKNAFAYHMWVQAYIGKWINLDPSNPNDSFSPVHIALYESPLNSLSDKTDMVLNVIKTLSGFKIDVLSSNMLNAPVTEIKIPKAADSSSNDFNLIKFIKDNEQQFIKKISLKDKEEQNKTGSVSTIQLKDESFDEYLRAGYFNYSQGNIEKALEDFTKASGLVSLNDDFQNIQFAIKLASLGFFKLADKELADVYDSQIWAGYIKKIKTIYYPKIVPVADNEILCARALSNIQFQNNPAKAIELLKTRKVKGTSDYIEYLMSLAYAGKKENDLALKHINKAIEINPSNPTYRLHKATVLASLKKYNDSLKELSLIQNTGNKQFDRNVKIQEYFVLSEKNKQQPAGNIHLARYYMLKGEYQTARNLLQKSIKEKANNTQIYTLLGDISYELKEFDQARKEYEIALRYDRKNIKATIGLANTKFVEGKFKESLNLYQQALKADPNSLDIMLKIAENYKMLAEEEQAYKYYNRILSKNSSNVDAIYNLAVINDTIGETDKAVEQLKKSLSIDPMHAESWIHLTNIQLKRNNSFLARIYLTPVGHINKNIPEYHYYLGLINKNIENYTEARKNFQRALELNPGFTKAATELDKLKQ